MSKYKLVKVNWVDSTSPRMGWMNLSEWNGVGCLDCISVGYLIHESNDAKTIAPHLAYPDEEQNSQINGVIVIPNQAITSIEELTSSL